MLCNKEEFQVKLSGKIVPWQIFSSHRSAWFPRAVIYMSPHRVLHLEFAMCLCIVKAHFYCKIRF